jgi:uncharacterized protein YbcV (DUF1398 family)
MAGNMRAHSGSVGPPSSMPGYTYMGFCAKVAQAGCAGYVVSLLGRRMLYYGRTCETCIFRSIMVTISSAS